MTNWKWFGWRECVLRIILEFFWTNRGNHRKLQLGYPAFQLRFEPRTVKYEIAVQ
jgi:hypothetical protein